MAWTVPAPDEVFDVPLDDGAAIAVRRHGRPDGRVRLFLSHGNGFAIDGYLPFWSRFADRCELVVFDFRNHGHNAPSDPAHHTYAQMARDLERVYRDVTARLGPKISVGAFHSMSGRTAMKHAIEIGWRWDALVLFDPPNMPPPGHAVFPAMSAFENKLTGWFDPPIVLKQGYREDSFLAGPLVQAMRDGSVLFINELNRMPESVQNVLLPALDEGLVILPRIGDVRAAAGFQVVATQNPVEYIATGHLSEALKDRFEHILLLHQNEEEEREIVRRRTGCADEELVQSAVSIVRHTRVNPSFRKGASVRAAVSIVSIVQRLAESDGRHDAEARLRLAALAALATRVELRDEEDGDLASKLDQILDAVKKN